MRGEFVEDMRTLMVKYDSEIANLWDQSHIYGSGTYLDVIATSQVRHPRIEVSREAALERLPVTKCVAYREADRGVTVIAVDPTRHTYEGYIPSALASNSCALGEMATFLRIIAPALRWDQHPDRQMEKLKSLRIPDLLKNLNI